MRFAGPDAAPRRRLPGLRLVEVALLAVIFAVTAAVLAWHPAEIAARSASGSAPRGVLVLRSDGGIGYGAARGAAVFEAIRGHGSDRLRLRWGGGRTAGDLSALLPGLRAAGVRELILDPDGVTLR